MKLKKFKIERFKKDGSRMVPVKITKGIYIEPHTEKQEGIIYYPGTLIPSIHHMEVKKYDPYKYLAGGPMPWTDPSTIVVNKELLQTEDLYDKIIEAKKNKDTEKVKYYSQPLVSWRCPATGMKKSLYAQAMTISNRNDKSNYVYENLHRFEEGIEKLTEIYNKERISNVGGISALINLLAAKFCFRVGNNENSGIGVTTFRPKNIEIDEKGRIHFRFIGKKGVKWHKRFTPENELEQKMFDDIVELKNKNNEFLFWHFGKRVTSTDANSTFRRALSVQEEEKDYLSFHSWRHYNASKAFVSEMKNIKIDKAFKKIENGKSKNKELKRAQEINKQFNGVFEKVSKLLNDTPSVVKVTYAGGRIFKDFYEKHDIVYDEKKRTFEKSQFVKAKEDVT